MAGLQEGRTIEGALAFEDAVRISIEVDELRLRAADRVASRLPVIARSLAPRLIAAPAGSRIRVALVTRMMVAGCAATDRRDWGFLQRFHAPELVHRSVPGFYVDWPEHAVGWPAFQAALSSFMEAFGDTGFQPVELFDLGGPFFCVRLANRAEGRSSGIAVDTEFFYTYEMGADGVAVRQWATNTLAEAAAFYEQRLAETRG